MFRLLGLTQSELANVLCVALTTLGIVLSTLSLFSIPGLDRAETKSLGDKFLGGGVSIGFGVSVSRQRQSTRKKKESSQSDNNSNPDSVEPSDNNP